MAYLVGLSILVGRGSVYGTYQRVAKRNLNQFGIDDARDGVAIGYRHGLSKRTESYAYASRYSNVSMRADAVSRLADTRQLSVGVRHFF